jgi:hypothetical protein
MEFSIQNNSGQAVVYASMFGIDTDSNWCIYDFKTNALIKCVTGDTVAKDYLTTVGTEITISDMPQLASGIILFSYNKEPEDFAVVADANGIATVQSPSFLVGTSDYKTIFNVVEFTLSGSVFVDITNVDFFSTPIELHLTGKNNDGAIYDQSKGSMNADRGDVFTDFKSETKGTPFAKLAVSDNGIDVRILGPQHGVDSSLIPTSYFDDYVNKCWDYYTHNKLSIKTNLETYTAQVNISKNQLEVSNSDGAMLYIFPKFGPNKASDIFGCAGVLAAPNNEYGAISARIGAALNRSTLLTNSIQPDCNVLDYYKDTTTNLYACVLHKFYNDGTTYAFPFDDVCSGSSTLSCQIPGSLTITLGAF